jgi:hypothetical protein
VSSRRLGTALTLGAALAVTATTVRVTAAADAPSGQVDAPDARPATPSTELRVERDEEIATAVSHALADDSRVRAMNVKVAVRHGVVTLTGKANDADEKRATEEVARAVRGVRDVDNQLVAAEPGAPAPGASVIPEVPSAQPQR